MARWVLCLLLLPPPGSALRVAIDPRPGPFFDLVLEGEAGDAGSGDFRGVLSLNGSSVEMPISGRAAESGGRLRLAATVRYTDVPKEFLVAFRPDMFDYRIRAEIGGAGSVVWAGSMRWSEITVAGGSEALSRFVRLGSFELTDLSAKRSEGRAVLSVTNPFAFPVRIASAAYRLRVNGEPVGAGAARGRTLRARREKAPLELPYRVDQASFLSAAGSRWAVGADVDAGLSGSLTLGLPGGEVDVPFEFRGPMGTDGARSGVFGYPEGATSLSPH